MKRLTVFCLVVLVVLLFISASGDRVQANNAGGIKVNGTAETGHITDNDSPVLVVERCLLNFAVTNLGTATGTQRILVRNCGGGTMDWTVTISVDATWLECTPASGTNFGVVEVSLNGLAGLTVGANPAEITVTAPDAVNSPQTVSVNTTLYNSVSPGVPFGYFETPENNSVISGVVPFTGWALDEIDVVNTAKCNAANPDEEVGVRIYHDVDSDLICIGSAIFVERARPDVEQIYPNYPKSDQAGWGYMMLTNVLPDGPHVFHAKAVDKEGNEVTLGTKSVIINNASAKKPFGTLDTPCPGCPISSVFRVWGWALTPPPDSIPCSDHSVFCDAVVLYIDGLNVGKVHYGTNRNDVCSLFPGYNNCPKVGFYFDFDSSEYCNGIHTIFCHVTDTGNDSDGIGSRFFHIWNLGTTNCCMDQTSSQTQFSIPRPEIADIPINNAEPISIQKGYNEEVEPQFMELDKNAQTIIEIRELERIKIRLNPLKNSNFNHYCGYFMIGNKLMPLPIGSFLDAEKGIFYWMPGPGFVGPYRFIFLEEKQNREMSKTFITVNILPKFTGKAD